MAKAKTVEESRAYWNILADSYDKYYAITTIQVNTLLIPLLNLDPSHTVAECGCGTGTGIEILLRYYPTLTKILASDLSEEMISRAQSKGFSNTDFFVANNENLPYDSESCDRYVSNLSLHFVENPENMIKEAYRVLKQSGIAVFSVWGKPGDNNILRIMGKSSALAGIDPPQERSPFYLNNQELLNRLIREAGFKNVRSLFTAVPFILKTVEDLLGVVDSRQDVIQLKEDSREKYDTMMNALRDEYERITNEGKFITFDVLIAVGEKV